MCYKIEGCSPITEDVWERVMDEDDLFDYANRRVGRETQVVKLCTENENSGQQLNNDEHDNDKHDNKYEST